MRKDHSRRHKPSYYRKYQYFPKLHNQNFHFYERKNHNLICFIIHKHPWFASANFGSSLPQFSQARKLEAQTFAELCDRVRAVDPVKQLMKAWKNW